MGRTLKQHLYEASKSKVQKRFRERWREYRHARKSKWFQSWARCIGSSHIKLEQPCQDWASVRRYDNGVIAITLADGAGSSKLSHYGASMVVNRAPAIIADHFDEAFGNANDVERFKHRLVSQLQIEMSALARIGVDVADDERARFAYPSRGKVLLVPCDVSDLSCTLLCVAVKGDQYIAVHVGDGVIGMETRHRGAAELSVVSRPDNGEFANETHFITSRNALELSRIVCGRLNSPRGRVTGFILMSDGPEAALYNKRESSLAPACSKLFEACRELEPEEMRQQLEATLRQVISQKTSDDCSLALMARA